MSIVKLSRQEWLFLGVLFVAVVVFQIAILPSGHNWGGDFAQYIIHARNIAEGRPYADTGYLYEPTTLHAPPNYPPVVPLMLAPIWAWKGMDYYFWMSMPEILLFGVACVLLYVWSRRFLPPMWAGAAAVLCTTNYITFEGQGGIGSDWPYLGISLAIVVFYFWIQDRGWDETRPWIAGIAIGFALLIGVETRAVGAALPLAFVIAELATYRKIRPYAIASGLVVVIGYVAVKRALHYDSGSYADQFVFQPIAYLKFAARYTWLLFTYTWVNGVSGPVRFIVSAVMFPMSLIGLWLAWRRPTFVEWYSLVIVGVNVAYSPTTNERYLMPMIPFFLAWTLNGAKWLWDHAPVSMRRPALAMVALLLTLNCGLILWKRVHWPYDAGPDLPAFQEVVKFVREKTDPHAHVLSWNPRLLTLYTGRPGAVYHFKNDPSVLAKDLQSKNVSYVLTYSGDTGDENWLIPMVQAMPNRLEPIFHNSDFTIYRVIP